MSGRSEREKMLAGQPYYPADAELASARMRARALCHRYNGTSGEEESLRIEILAELLGESIPPLHIEPPFRCDYGANIFLGEDFYANYGCVILDCAEVRIGNQVKFGPYVQIYAAHHPLDHDERKSGWELASPVSIGDDVWLGGGVIVLPGVSIGARSVIGAGSVVSRSVPDGVVAAGNPCRVIRRLGAHDGPG